jgi:AraC-like DNA-binding protein
VYLDSRLVTDRPELADWVVRVFAAVSGMSIREYHARARVCAAVRQFATGTHDVLAVARCVGYRSEKNFYRAVSKFTGLTPAELRDAKLPCAPATCGRLMGPSRHGVLTPWCAIHRLQPRKPTGA